MTVLMRQNPVRRELAPFMSENKTCQGCEENPRIGGMINFSDCSLKNRILRARLEHRKVKNSCQVKKTDFGAESFLSPFEESQSLDLEAKSYVHCFAHRTW